MVLVFLNVQKYKKGLSLQNSPNGVQDVGRRDQGARVQGRPDTTAHSAGQSAVGWAHIYTVQYADDNMKNGGSVGRVV